MDLETLNVIDIGSSGSAGATYFLPPVLGFADAFASTWGALDPDGAAIAGASIEFAATGMLGGKQGAPLGSLSVTRASSPSASR